MLATLSLGLALVSCGGGGTPGPPPNPVPTLSSISPDNTTAGSGGFTLTATGTNFISGSKVRWKGSTRTTTFVSATQLTSTISTLDIAVSGTADVTVFNPAPGGGVSSAKTFTINNPVPAVSNLSPTNAVAGTAGFTLTVNGSNFVSNSVARWNGSDRTTSFASNSQLTAQITAADISSIGSASVTVSNPTPGGGESGGAPFDILAALPLAVNTTRLPDTGGNKSYNVLLASTGGVAPIAWSIFVGALPASLALDPLSGRISGNVDALGADTTVNFTVRATDSASPTPTTSDMPLSILVHAGALGRNNACTPGSTAGTTAISNGRIRASISPYGDIDVYNFQGTAGQQVSIEIFAARLDLDGDPTTRDSWLDSVVELLDNSCPASQVNGVSALAWNDDIDPGVVQDSLIQNFTLPSTGLYFIRVRDFRGDGRPDLIYELSLSGAN